MGRGCGTKSLRPTKKSISGVILRTCHPYHPYSHIAPLVTSVGDQSKHFLCFFLPLDSYVRGTFPIGLYQVYFNSLWFPIFLFSDLENLLFDPTAMALQPRLVCVSYKSKVQLKFRLRTLLIFQLLLTQMGEWIKIFMVFFDSCNMSQKKEKYAMKLFLFNERY